MVVWGDLQALAAVEFSWGARAEGGRRKAEGLGAILGVCPSAFRTQGAGMERTAGGEGNLLSARREGGRPAQGGGRWLPALIRRLLDALANSTLPEHTATCARCKVPKHTLSLNSLGTLNLRYQPHSAFSVLVLWHLYMQILTATTKPECVKYLYFHKCFFRLRIVLIAFYPAYAKFPSLLK